MLEALVLTSRSGRSSLQQIQVAWICLLRLKVRDGLASVSHVSLSQPRRECLSIPRDGGRSTMSLPWRHTSGVCERLGRPIQRSPVINGPNSHPGPERPGQPSRRFGTTPAGSGLPTPWSKRHVSQVSVTPAQTQWSAPREQSR